MLSNLNKYHIILASKSPRRQELLRGMGVDFEILTKETAENYPADLPLDEVPKYLRKTIRVFSINHVMKTKRALVANNSR